MPSCLHQDISLLYLQISLDELNLICFFLVQAQLGPAWWLWPISAIQLDDFLRVGGGRGPGHGRQEESEAGAGEDEEESQAAGRRVLGRQQ